jgi:glycosyltransferase involved in cell wall biosynthesis
MSPDETRPSRILFVVTEDWFFVSHFLPMARAAKDKGHDVAVACRVRDHREILEAEGLRVLPLEADRKSLNPVAILGTVQRMRQMMRAERPDIVHLIALRSIIVGGIAARLAGVSRRVFALTGLGLIGAGQGLRSRILRAALRRMIRWIAGRRGAHFLFENRSDPILLGLEPDDRGLCTIVGGAGVNPAALSPAPLPPHPPLRLAMIARMLWSKGPDLAVEAVSRARDAGHQVTLDLYGAPDPANPRSISEAQLDQWGRKDGIRCHGAIRQQDVSRVWAESHAALVPSRGGEGLPRSLLEAAACGRLILTTRVPGCQDFVRDGIEGSVVPADDVAALTAAIIALATHPERLEEQGAAARARLLEGYTEERVGADVANLYQRLLDQRQTAR